MRYHSNMKPFRSPTVHAPRRGLATLMALVTLAVVASTVMLLAQTMLQERRVDAARMEHIQQKVLEQDMKNIIDLRKK